MSRAVFHTTRCAANSKIASSRVARYLATKLACELYDDRVPDQYHDDIFVVNSMGAFSSNEFRLALADQVRHCKRMIFVQQDYTIHPTSQVQKVLRDERGWSHNFPFKTGPVLWTTVPQFMCKPQDSYVNWNCLTYDPEEYNGLRERGIVYWGSYRKDREPSFVKYLCTGLYPVHLLVPDPVFNKFADLNFNVRGGGLTKGGKPWKTTRELAMYDATLYIEDERQHDEFHSVANRFYEALSAGLAIFIDKNAVNTFDEEGLYVDPKWVVSSAQDVAHLLPSSRKIAEEQKAAWPGLFREELDHDIAAALRRL